MVAASRQLAREVERAVDAIRARETERALRRLGLDGDSRSAEVEALAERVCERILSPVLRSVRQAERRGDGRLLRDAERILLNLFESPT